jgi:hypothetical protein
MFSQEYFRIFNWNPPFNFFCSDEKLRIDMGSEYFSVPEVLLTGAK